MTEDGPQSPVSCLPSPIIRLPSPVPHPLLFFLQKLRNRLRGAAIAKQGRLSNRGRKIMLQTS